MKDIDLGKEDEKITPLPEVCSTGVNGDRKYAEHLKVDVSAETEEMKSEKEEHDVQDLEMEEEKEEDVQLAGEEHEGGNPSDEKKDRTKDAVEGPE